MQNLKLIRAERSDEATRGVLLINDILFCCALELPFIDNTPFISCIPAGIYPVRAIHSPRFGYTFEICGVPGRKHILFHWGNIPEDTEGCIILGRYFGVYKSMPAVLDSKKTFNSFLRAMYGLEKARIQIINGG